MTTITATDLAVEDRVDDAYVPNGPAAALFHPVLGGQWTPAPAMPDGTPWPTMGYAAAAWIETNTPLVLDPWQIELLVRGFAYHPDTCDWIVRDVLLVGPEGLGKSAFLAAVLLWIVAGPMVPPLESATHHPDPNVPVVSAALSLTKHIRKYAKQYVEQGPLAGRVVVENTKLYRADDPDAGAVWPAGSGAYNQGENPRPAIIEEELHVLNAPGVRADGIETIEVISGKRSKTHKPVACQRWTITNPDDGDPDSLLGRRWSHARKVIDGEVVDPSILAVHYRPALPVNLDDPADLRRAIREATPSTFTDREAIAAKYEKDRQSAARFSRYSLGLFRSGDDAILPDGTLEALVVDRDAPTLGDGVRVVYGFDGSRNRDSVAVFAATIPDGPAGQLVAWEAAYWARPPEADDTWRYPRATITAELRRLLDEDPTAMLAMDDQWWEDIADELELEYPGRVVRGYQSEGPAAWATFRRVVLDGRVRFVRPPASAEHAPDAGAFPYTLLAHVRNAREVESRGGATVKLTKYRTDVRIDMLVTATYAVRLATALAGDLDDTVTEDEWLEALTGGDDGDDVAEHAGLTADALERVMLAAAAAGHTVDEAALRRALALVNNDPNR